MPHDVRMSARAEFDADEALSWLMERSEQAAARWQADLLHAVQSLEDHPHRYPLAAEADRLGIELRELTFGKRRNVYRILYTIADANVTVHHIRHAARDWLQPGEI